MRGKCGGGGTWTCGKGKRENPKQGIEGERGEGMMVTN